MARFRGNKKKSIFMQAKVTYLFISWLNFIQKMFYFFVRIMDRFATNTVFFVIYVTNNDKNVVNSCPDVIFVLTGDSVRTGK